MPKINFLPDKKVLEVENGETILQTAIRNNIPHVNACGGEGKCTTCRLVILEGAENCSEQTDQEKALKEKVHTTDEFRLACQTQADGDITVRRLVLNKEDIEFISKGGVSGRLGETKKIAILFSDIRGFTPFSEKLTPYDVVFILNRYFTRMVKSVEDNNGKVDNYIGDGMVAIFGLYDEKKLGSLVNRELEESMIKSSFKNSSTADQARQAVNEVETNYNYSKLLVNTATEFSFGIRNLLKVIKNPRYQGLRKFSRLYEIFLRYCTHIKPRLLGN